jgi:hypothetical protein
VAVLWPARLTGPLDGIPLDRPVEAALLGLLLAFLVVLEPRILRRSIYRGLVIALVIWKAASGAALVQDGWCLQFTTPQPLYRNMGLVPHAWDVRADWRSPAPRCSAVMTRPYPSIDRFPIWFYNLPPAVLEEPATEADRPPRVTLKFALSGFLNVRQPGVFQLGAGEDVRASGRLDGVEVSSEVLAAGLPVPPGDHYIAIEGDLRDSGWRLTPAWNGDDLWPQSIATMSASSAIDRWARPWGGYVPALVISWLLAVSLIMIGRRARSGPALAFSGIAAALAAASTIGGRPALMRLVPVLLIPVAAIRWPRRLQTWFGACLLVGVPFLALIAAMAAPQAGAVTWYTAGDDWWMFQRYAYRIFLQGYWLEGGQPTFWFQPLYRWIAGALHMVFGDSSIGEVFWDGACVLTGAMFAFATTRAFATFRWAIAAAVATLAVFLVGPPWYLIGRGLSEITSAGLIYAAALLALRGRHGHWPSIAAAGALAVLGFYTRLNNLTIAAAVALFALPVRLPAAELWTPRRLMARASPPVIAGVLGAIAAGLGLFALRTWYYTGVFSLFYGTQASALTVWQETDDGQSTPYRVIGSVLMMLTMNDPPRFDVRAIPIIVGVLASALAVVRTPLFRRLPLNLVGFCLAGFSGSLIARGTAYPGRFSVHLVPVAAALTMCVLSMLWGGRQRSSRA